MRDFPVNVTQISGNARGVPFGSAVLRIDEPLLTLLVLNE